MKNNIDSVYYNFWGKQKPKFTDMELALMEGGHSIEREQKYTFLKQLRDNNESERVSTKAR